MKLLLAVSALIATGSAVADSSNGGWEKCAREGESCECHGTVRYGARGHWNFKQEQVSGGKTSCTNGVFGDPLPGVRKACECASGSGGDDDSERPFGSGVPETAWSRCAKEGGVCECTGSVRYGERGQWSYLEEVAESVSCTNGVFGDPLPGTRKRCDCVPSAAHFGPAQRGFCVLADGSDQNEGVLKIDDLDGDSAERQAECVAKCRAHEATIKTGCEMIFSQSNHGCYLHTQSVARGNGVPQHLCWLNDFTSNDDDDEFEIPDKLQDWDFTLNYCVDQHGRDQFQTDAPDGDVSIIACADLCSANPRCSAIEWYASGWSGSKCKLMLGSVPSTGGKEGLRWKDAVCLVNPARLTFNAASSLGPDPEGWAHYLNFCADQGGRDLSQSNAPEGDESKLACAKACESKSACSAIEWYQSGWGGSRCKLMLNSAAKGSEGARWNDAECFVRPKDAWKWVVELSSPEEVALDVGRDRFNAMFATCPVVRYWLRDDPEALVVYVRMTKPPADFDAYEVFTATWEEGVDVHNKLNFDFRLTDSLEDDEAWSFCNDGDFDVGFPRDCGKHKSVGGRWFSFPGGPHNSRRGRGFEIWSPSTELPCPVEFASEDPVSPPSVAPDEPWWTWAVELSSPTEVALDVGRDRFNAMFATCPVVRYWLRGAPEALVVYVRMTEPPADFDAYEVFTATWEEGVDVHNKLNFDFRLIDSLEDDEAWTYCNDGDFDVGFPRDCGKHKSVGWRWFSFPGGPHNSRRGRGFQIFTPSLGRPCPAQFGQGGGGSITPCATTMSQRLRNCLAYPYKTAPYLMRFREGCESAVTRGTGQVEAVEFSACVDSCYACTDASNCGACTGSRTGVDLEACRAACRSGCEWMNCSASSTIDWRRRGCELYRPEWSQSTSQFDLPGARNYQKGLVCPELHLKNTLSVSPPPPSTFPLAPTWPLCSHSSSGGWSCNNGMACCTESLPRRCGCHPNDPMSPPDSSELNGGGADPSHYATNPPADDESISDSNHSTVLIVGLVGALFGCVAILIAALVIYRRRGSSDMQRRANVTAIESYEVTEGIALPPEEQLKGGSPNPADGEFFSVAVL